MHYTNSDKSKHGSNAQDNIKILLKNCVQKRYIKNYTLNYRVGMPNYKNQEQFYAPFLLTFEDNVSWIVFSTTSLRTDRIKGQQWDSLNIKNINSSISKSLLVYPDNIPEKEIQSFKAQNKKYINNIEYSCIDLIVNQDELYNLIEGKALSQCSQGQKKEREGNNFEDRIALCLSNEENLQIWKTNDPELMLFTGLHYSIYKKIMDDLKIEKNNISRIEATSDKKIIGKLPSGGFPKTDIHINIYFSDNTKQIVNISCKRTSEKSVSVHQYSANSFSEILDPNNLKLKHLLEQFQRTPSLRDFGKENENALTKEISTYNDKLSKWVLGGIDGYGNCSVQWATHILTYDNNTNRISFHSIDDYIDILKKHHVSGHFGTLFTWTYASKQRGKSIQLKCKIV